MIFEPGAAGSDAGDHAGALLVPPVVDDEHLEPLSGEIHSEECGQGLAKDLGPAEGGHHDAHLVRQRPGVSREGLGISHGSPLVYRARERGLLDVAESLEPRQYALEVLTAAGAAPVGARRFLGCQRGGGGDGGEQVVPKAPRHVARLGYAKVPEDGRG